MTASRLGRAGLSLAAAVVFSVGVGAYTPASAATVTLTNADSGKTVLVPVGDTVKVTLTPKQAQGLKWTWRVPSASDSGVLERTAGSTSPNGGATAVFKVQEPGTSAITAQGVCKPVASGAECPSTTRTWKVSIEVD
ncbi:hypothetical protein [Yinghuangia soli]|uniref:Proteinase inhibitor I42 chagasin domain-containing protein n=1 Tax=Yinghuangia soli TaxID=2908204 RepID=A0AA41U068_9ACTN|nr:hypothetical protein [Yinghuangia soli]MCF2526127.1 hypothetical protein [Yinghuangia soli]